MTYYTALDVSLRSVSIVASMSMPSLINARIASARPALTAAISNAPPPSLYRAT